jgi:uncharacterized membrane protein YfcA
LLGLFLPPAQVAALLVVPALATNVAQCRGPALRSLAARLWPMWLGLAAACVWCPGFDGAASVAAAHRILGAVLVLYGLWGLWRPAIGGAALWGSWSVLGIGALTGVVTAATAVFAVPMVPYLQALRLDRESMVQALGLSFTVATLALALRLQGAGHLVAAPGWVALALTAALAGIWVGARLRLRLSPSAFQRALFGVFVLLGAVDLWRGM